MTTTVEQELIKTKIEDAQDRYMKSEMNASQTMCFEVIRRLNVFLVTFAIILFSLILISWPTWKNALIFGVPIAYLFLLQIPLTALNDLYVTEALVLFALAYMGMLLAYIVIDFYDFLQVFSILMDTGNIGAVCSKPYCQGWQAYTFFAFYFVLIINFMLAVAVVMMFIRIFYLETKIKRKIEKRAVDNVQLDYIKSRVLQYVNYNNNNVTEKDKTK